MSAFLVRYTVLHSVLLLGSIGCLPGCSPFHEIVNADKLGAGEKVIVGEVRIVGGDLNEWVAGFLTSAELVLGYRLPVNHGHVFISPFSEEGDAVSRFDAESSSFDRHGGLFRVGIRNQDAYLISIRTASSYVVGHAVTTFPLVVWIEPSPNRCEYIGTLIVRRVNRQILVNVKDDYERFRVLHPSFVTGCSLAKSMATVMTPEQRGQYAAGLRPARAVHGDGP